MNAMKKSAIFCLLALPVLIRAQVNITYDQFNQDKNFKWVANGTTFNNFQGILYCIAYQKYTINAVLPKEVAGWPTVYVRNETSGEMVPYNFGKYNSNSFSFGYEGESTADDAPQILGNVMLFQFNGRLWYFQQTNPKLYPAMGPRIKDNYECFQQMPLNPAEDGFRFYLHFPDWPDVVKKGAFQADSNTLVFIGHNENKESADYLKWYLWEYSFNPANSYFSRGNAYILDGVIGTQFGGVVKHREKSGKPWYVLSTSFPDSYIGYLTPNPNPGIPYTYRMEALIREGYATSMVIAGSIQGERSGSSVYQPENSSRFAEFSICNAKSSDGNYHLAYRDFYIQTGKIFLASQGEVLLPSASYPRDVDGNFFLQGAYELDLASIGTEIQGFNALKQKIWVFYPDKNKILNGAGFNSDIWKNMEQQHTVWNTDLSDTSYTGIRNLWSLTGIVDGPPPCSVNWPLWINSHSDETEPTELNFTSDQESEAEITSSYEDKYTLGEEINLGYSGEALGASMNEEFQYSNSFKNLASSTTTITTTYSNAFGLDEEFQDKGYYIWSIPQIKRFTYIKYAWWDTHYAYPDTSSLQFLFRVFGTEIITENRDLAGFPFYVESPNDSTLAGWKTDKRTAIVSSAVGYGLSPIMNLSWDDGAHGSKGTYAISNDSVSTYESGTTYEAKIGVTVKVPEIFKANISAGSEVNYSTETSIKTKFGQEIEASLYNLTSRSKGPNIGSLDISTYWFRNEDGVKWWYYDELGDQRPWYIAYIVNDARTGKILPLTPGNGQNLKSSELLFAWKAEGFEADNYTIYITTIGHVTPSAVIIERSTGKAEEISLNDFNPHPGTTYYWTVKGSRDRDIVWSRTQSFTIPAENPGSDETTGLKATLYPNPGGGRDIHVLLSSQESGKKTISLNDLSGKMIYRIEVDYIAPAPATITLPTRNLEAGIYFVSIRCESVSTTKKLIIH